MLNTYAKLLFFYLLNLLTYYITIVRRSSQQTNPEKLQTLYFNNLHLDIYCTEKLFSTFKFYI